jgi:hypothetical protein
LLSQPIQVQHPKLWCNLAKVTRKILRKTINERKVSLHSYALLRRTYTRNFSFLPLFKFFLFHPPDFTGHEAPERLFFLLPSHLIPHDPRLFFINEVIFAFFFAKSLSSHRPLLLILSYINTPFIS